MTDPGLTNRLRQHSRRAGLNVGVSMALAIAICIFGFATIYARLTPVLSDFVGQDARTEVDRPSGEADDGAVAARRQPTPTPQPEAAPSPTPRAQVTAVPTEPAAAFSPTHQANSSEAINLRSSPGVTADNSNLLHALPLAAPLQFLDEQQTVAGEAWMKVRTEEGEEGWVLAGATEPYQESA